MNLKQEMSKLPKPITDKKPPEWDYWRQELWQLAQSDEPENFTKWPCVYHTMLQNHWPDAIQWEFWSLPARWQNLAVCPKSLDDYFSKPGQIYSATYSLALIHQLYHLYRWQDRTDVSK